MPERKIRQQYEKSVQRIAGKHERRSGWIGASASQIQTGIGDLIYVRLTNNQIVMAVNKIAPLVYNFPVIIARSNANDHWEVVELRQVYGGTSLPSLKDHHLQHEYPSRDTVWIRDAQFMPLLVLPSSGMIVRLYGGVVRQNGSYYIVENQTIDLSASQPTTGAKWALIEVVDGTITTTLSTEYDNKEALIPSLIPTGTGKRLCAIRLYGGQEAIQRHGDVNDFVDLRWTAEAVATILDDLTDVDAPSPTDGQVLTYDSYLGLWVPADPVGSMGALDDLTDVDAPSPTDGQVLTYDSYLGLWVPADAGGGAVDSVNGQTGTVVLDADDIDDTSTTHKFATSAQLTQIATNQTDISNHVADTDDAHDASAISIGDSGGYFTATDVEGALQELSVRGGREALTADRTYYVRTDGSDSNDGLSNTSGGAFLTIQKAVDVAASLDFVTHNVVVQVADGTYTDPVVVTSWLGAGTLTIQGNTTTPANVVLSTSTTAFRVDGTLPASLIIAGMKLQSSSGHLIFHSGFGNLLFVSMDFGSCPNGRHIYANGNGACIIHAGGSHTISGNAFSHLLSISGGFINTNSASYTLIGTPNFLYFAYATRLGLITSQLSSYTGSATGLRYLVNSNGVIYTAGGANHFPGNSAGSASTGGQYV